MMFFSPIIFLFILFVSGLFSIIGYNIFLFLFKKVKRLDSIDDSFKRSTKIIFVTLTICYSLFETYTAFYPLDSFYFSEFERVTQRVPKPTYNIISKTSDYPDFHGDYSSSCLITMTNEDYIELFNQILKDKRFERVDYLNYKIKGLKTTMAFRRPEYGENDENYVIIFLSDRRTIEINVDIT